MTAIHPGYGFLSENEEFCGSVEAAGIAWLGPTAKTLHDFALKHVARKIAEEAGVSRGLRVPLFAVGTTRGWAGTSKAGCYYGEWGVAQVASDVCTWSILWYSLHYQGCASRVGRVTTALIESPSLWQHRPSSHGPSATVQHDTSLLLLLLCRCQCWLAVVC